MNLNLSRKFVNNAKIALEVACQGKPGESVLVLVDNDAQRVACAQALETGALELGMRPIIQGPFGLCLTGKGRRMEYQHVNMENWNITKEGHIALGKNAERKGVVHSNHRARR